MKRELEFFHIGDSFGGNQDWFYDPMMHLGGCGAATACDICIDLALRKGMTHLYPFDLKALDRKQYIRFSKIMKPYLRPRTNGINRLDLYTEGFGRYLRDAGDHRLVLEEIEGDIRGDDAWEFIRRQIEDEMPIAYLMLKHRDKALSDFVWHWFLLVGYEEADRRRSVKTATYGEGMWLDFDHLWNTGFEEKGGMVLIREDSPV